MSGGVAYQNGGMGAQVMLTDVVLSNGAERNVQIIRPCGHLGMRTHETAKTDCKKNAEFAPVYRCPIYRLCSPFAVVTDSDLIRPCEGCPKYTATQSSNVVS